MAAKKQRRTPPAAPADTSRIRRAMGEMPAPVDTVALKQRMARDESLADGLKRGASAAEAEANIRRDALGRSSIGEKNDRDFARHARMSALGHDLNAGARRDTLEAARKGKVPAKKATRKQK